jgi:hypothetical protein
MKLPMKAQRKPSSKFPTSFYLLFASSLPSTRAAQTRFVLSGKSAAIGKSSGPWKLTAPERLGTQHAADPSRRRHGRGELRRVAWHKIGVDTRAMDIDRREWASW